MNSSFNENSLLGSVRDAELRRSLTAFVAAPDDDVARREVFSVLGSAPTQQWLMTAVELANGGAIAAAITVLGEARVRWPKLVDVHQTLAEVLFRNGQLADAEAALAQSGLAERSPVLAMQLARILRNQARLDGAKRALLLAEAADWSDDALVEALQFLKQCQREIAALGWCERELLRGRTDARLFAMAGNLAMALGHFEPARDFYLQAMARGVDLNVWYVPQAFAHCRRYTRIDDPDIAMLTALRDTAHLDARAKAGFDFTTAKMKEEGGDIAAAVTDYRRANVLLRATQPWQREAWLRAIEMRLRSTQPASTLAPTDFSPVFVVGLPRTGTTLVAERLARHAGVRSRGEPPFLEFIARQLDGLGVRADQGMLRQAANLYATQMRQDDAPAHWYLDKNPLNFRYLDIVARLFPQARVVYCERDARDTAASIWTQHFAQADYGFANDFGDIRLVHEGAKALMQHWRANLPLALLTVNYERLVDDTAAVDAELARFLNLPELSGDTPRREGSIGTASVFQARQPVYRHAVGRAERFAPFLPELRAAFA